MASNTRFRPDLDWLYEVSKYISLDAHTTDFFIVSINKGGMDCPRRTKVSSPRP
jgi:hypothetical protein